MRLKHLLSVFLTLLTLGVGNAWGGTTYKLTQVSSVSAGNKYVFVQDGYAMNNSVNNSSQLVCTNSYNTTGLTGTETYVWTLETATNGFYMKNVSLSSNQYLKTSSTNCSFGAKTNSPGIFSFTFSSNICLIEVQNNQSGNKPRFLGYTSSTSHAYKAYANSNLSTYPHDVTVYQLEEEASCQSWSDPTITYSATTLTAGGDHATVSSITGTTYGAVSYASSNTDILTVDAATGEVTPVANGTAKVTVSWAGNATYCPKDVDVDFTINKASASITLYDANGSNNPSGTFYSGDSYTTPTTAAACTGKTFVGWSTVEIPDEGDKPNINYYDKGTATILTAGTNTFYAVYATATEGGGDVTDVIDKALVDAEDANIASGSNGTWKTITVAGSNSGANYFIRTMCRNNVNTYAVRWNTNGYLYCSSAPTSGLKLKSVTVKTLANKDLNIYASTAKYSAQATATSLGTLSATTSGATFSLTTAQLANNYTCVAINGAASSTEIVSISITYSGGTSYSDYTTSCCQPLAQINGSVSGSQVSWSAVTDASGYKVKVDNGDWTDIGNVLSYTPTLACGSGNHNVYVKAYNTNNSGHCTGDGPESAALVVASAACTEPEIIVDPTSLTGLNYIVGVGPSAAQSFDVLGANLTGDLTVKTNDNYEICLTNSATAADWKSGNTTLTIAKATAEAGQTVYVRLKSGKTVGDYNSNTIKVYGGGVSEANAATVTVSGSVLKPTISVDPTSITGWNAQTGNAPSPTTKTIAVTGTNLKANITATLTAGSDYFTFTPESLTQTSGSASGTITIGVKEAAYASAGTPSGTLRLSTTDGDNVDVSFSLTVADDPREKFTLLTSSNLNQLSDGAKLVLVYDDYDLFEETHTYYAAKAGYQSSNGYDKVASSNTEFSISGYILYLEENHHVLILDLGEMTDGYSLYDGNKYLSNTTSNKLGNSDTEVAWTIAVDGGNAVITCTASQKQLIKFNTTANMSAPFRAYSATAGNTEYIKAYFQPSTTPSIKVTPSSLTGFTYVKGNGPSEAQNFSVSGMNLTGDLTVKAPTNYQVSVDGGESWSDAGGSKTITALGTLTSTTVKVRLAAGLDIDTYDDATGVKVYGGGILEANAKTVSLSGSVTNPSHTITVSAGENGSVSPSGAQTVEEGHTLQVTATPAAGYQLDKWTISGGATPTGEQTANPLTLTMGTENATATASFIQKMVTNIAISGDETIKPSQEKTYTATVTPNDALVTAVTWSVIAGTGTATINASTGVLTGGTPGTVTVRATATDGSLVYGEISVSVQEVTYYTYARLTSSDDVTTGEYLITYDGGGNNPTSAYVLKGSNIGCENYLSNVPISKVGDDYIITLEDNTDAFNINATEKTVVGIGSNKYMYTTTTENNSVVSSTDKKTFTALAYNNLQYSSNLYYLRWNNNGFRYYNQSTGVNAAIRLYRRMQLYNVTCNEATNGSVSANMSSAASGTTVTLTLTPAANYELDELIVTNVSTTETIETNGSGNSYTFTMPAANVSVSATFKAKVAHSITFANGGATTGSAPEAMEDQYSEAVITLPENTYVWPEHRFTGWQVTYGETVLDKAVGETFPMPDANVTITAQWEEIQYCALTLSINGVAQTPFNVVQLEEYDLTTHNPGTINGYSFVGWAESAEAEDVENDIHTIGTSYTPALNVATKTLYAVFSRQDNTNVGKYKRVKADLGTAWAGDYLIAYSATIFADGKKAGTEGIGKGNTNANPEDKLDGDFVDGTWGDTYKVTLEEVSTNSNTYLLKTQDNNYNYYASNASGLSSTNTRNTAANYPISVSYVSVGDIRLTLSSGPTFRYNSGSTSYFRYYKDAGQQPVYLYKKQTAATTKYTTRPETSYSVSYDLGEGAWGVGVSHNAVQVKNGMEFTITEDVPVLDHNKFTKWQVGGADVSNTITISGTTVITANWIAKVESTLTYDKGTGTGTNIVTNDVEESTNITLPAIGSGSGQANFTKEGYDFVGWLYEGTLYKSGETFVMPAVDATLVAQWKLQNIEKFALVTDASLLIDGMKVVLAFNDDADGTQKDNIAGEMHSNGYLQIVAATFANNEVTVGEGAVVFTLEAATNGWKLRKDGSNYLTSSGADLKWDNADNATIWTISFDDSDVRIVNGSNIIQFNYSSPRFKTYSGSQKDIQLYASQTIIANNASITEIGYVQGDIIVVGENKTLTVDAPIVPEAIIVKDGATVTANNLVNTNNLIVEAGGEVSGTANLTVNNLTINSEAGKSGQVMNATNVTASAVYMDVTFFKGAETLDATTAGRWYMISAPFDVNLNDGFINPVSGETMTFGQTDGENIFDLFEYDGNKRATTGVTGWKRVQGKMKAGTACLIGFNPGQPTTIRLKAASAVGEPESIALTPFPGDATNQNWNGVANPTLHYTNISKDVQIYNNEDGDNGRKYLPYSAETFSFVVGTAFFVQATGQIDLSAATHGSLRAPKRESERYEACVQIFRQEATEFADQMYVRASETASNEYEQGHDMITWNGTTGNTAMLWAENYGMRLAIEEAPLVNDKASYELGIFAPQAGTYRIAMTSEDDAELYLTYNGRAIWNLSMSECELELAQGQNEGYGLKLVVNAPAVVTGVDQIDAKAGVQKVIIDEHVYILRGGQMYNVNGKLVK